MTPSITRRDIFRLGAAGIASSCAAPWFQALSARAAEVSGRKHKACILVWLIGGPPQSLTFDLKSHSAFKPISTSASGVRISEHFPKLAKEMKDVTLLRGMRTSDSNHGTARYLMHTGFRKGQNGVSHPVLGSIVAQQLGSLESDLPNFISVGSMKFNGFGAGHLGPKFAPVRIEGDGMTDLKPAGSLKEFDAKADLLDDLNAAFLADHAAPSVQAHQVTLELRQPTHAHHQDESLRPLRGAGLAASAYGNTKFADQFLLARRLDRSGRQVRRNPPGRLGRSQGHGQSHPASQWRVGHAAVGSDRGPAAARTARFDTRDRNGRVRRNPANGSNHFSRAWTTLLAGGGLKHGRAIGDTGATGGTVEKSPITPGDFMATVCKTLEINWTQDWTINSGRPVPMVSKGAAPVSELF